MSQPHSRPQEIVDTALELIASRGIGHLTTAALARRLGFTEAALYRYYSGKNAILAAALQQVAEEVFRSMAAELAVSGDADARGLEELLGSHIRRFSARHGVLLDLLLAGTTSRTGELQEAGHAFLEEYFHRLAVFFDRAGEMRLTDSATPARDLSSMWICQLLGGFVRSRLTGATWDPERSEGYRGFLTRVGHRQPAAV